MCGRFTQTANKEEIEKEFKIDSFNNVNFNPRYNIAPSQDILAVRVLGAARELSELRWGLIPSWAKDPAIGNRMINARAETLTEKPSFQNAFPYRRCIIPATGFYEWKKGAGGKQPFYFYLKDKEIFGFAGLYEKWLDTDSGKYIETCTLITTAPNQILKPVHDRMPVILKPQDYSEWLDTAEKDTDKLQKLLNSYPADEMASHKVSKSVNVPGFDSSELILEIV